MKKFFKILSISLASLVLLLTIVVSVVLWIVFTPERITPIVKNQLPNFITCEAKLGSVKLTFFRTFPHFSLRIDDFALINPMEGACSDTLLVVERMEAKVDIRALLRNNELMLGDIHLVNGRICAFIDSDGNTNFDIFPPDTTETTPFEMPFVLVHVSEIELRNIDVNFVDNQSQMQARATNLSGRIDGSMRALDDVDVRLNLEPFDIHFFDNQSQMEVRIAYLSGIVNASMRTLDSAFVELDLNPFDLFFADHASEMTVEIGNFAPTLTANFLNSDSVRATFGFPHFGLSFNFGGEQYLRDASIALITNADIILSRQKISLEHFTAHINGLKLLLDGSVENDTENNQILTDISYSLQSWNIADLIALVPASFEHFLEGITVDGQISSEGKIVGAYGENSMPWLDIHLLLENGTATYAELLPFPLHGIYGDLNIYTDLSNDAKSFVRINNFRARTPQSVIQTSGRVNRLFSDPRVNLTTNANLVLAEFNSMIPKELKTTAKGRVDANVRTELTLSQVQNMELEKMRISGALELRNLDVVYDSISLKANRSTIEFSLPHSNPDERHLTFASGNITVDRLEASMIDGFTARLADTYISFATSDVRDTTRIPAAELSFHSKTLSAEMDSMSVDVQNPNIHVSVAPQRRHADQIRFGLAFSSGNLHADLADDTVSADKIDMRATVFHNPNEEEFFLKWMPRGFLILENGLVNTAVLPDPLQIPNIEMDFTPREFNIETASVVLGKSDFNLSGKLSNILSYFRGDGILEGRFTLASDFVDVNQLMALTSGLGDDEEVVVVAETPSETSGFSGPFMVPKGIDILLHTDIREALFQTNELSDISGDIRVADGILTMGELQMNMPGARVQLTAIYQSPRRNHLFAGVDFHLLDIEIEDLLNMIPDLDTIMPMLRSFHGRGEFHFVFETFLDSLYSPKFSTMFGAASVRGTDLLVSESDELRSITRALRFRRQDEIRIDSLTAEFTILRNEIRVYPFVLTADRYQVVIDGRHSLDMQMLYHFSIVQSPLPFRFTVNFNPDFRWIPVRPGRARWGDIHLPEPQGIVERQQMRLREQIRNALVRQVIVREEEEIND